MIRFTEQLQHIIRDTPHNLRPELEFRYMNILDEEHNPMGLNITIRVIGHE